MCEILLIDGCSWLAAVKRAQRTPACHLFLARRRLEYKFCKVLHRIYINSNDMADLGQPVEQPPSDGVSGLRFARDSNTLLASSWDGVSNCQISISFVELFTILSVSRSHCFNLIAVPTADCETL